MQYRPIVFLLALFLAVGLPAFIFVASLRAKASLKRLLAERFSRRPFPVLERLSRRPLPVLDFVVPSGGSVRLYEAYDDRQESGFVLVLGLWDRGKVRIGTGGVTSVSNDVAGLFRAGDASWMEQMRKDRRLIVKAVVEGGAVVIWKGWPSRRSVLAHLEAVTSLEPVAPPHTGRDITPASQPAKSADTGKNTPASHDGMLDPLDAFSIPLACADIGVPVLGFELMRLLQAPDPVGARIAAQRETYARGMPYAAQQTAGVERLLTQYGIAVESPINGSEIPFKSYCRWYMAVTQAIAERTASTNAEHALADIGRRLGELTQAMALHIALLRLGGTLKGLPYSEEQSGERLINYARELDKAAMSDALPAVVRPHAAPLAPLARSVIFVTEMPTLGGPAEQAVGLERIHKDLFALTDALRAALGK